MIDELDPAGERGNRQRGHSAKGRPDDRNGLGQRRDYAQQQRAVEPDHPVCDRGRDAHRSHEDQLALDPGAQARLHLVPGLAGPRPPVVGHERQREALQPRALRQPEIDQREQACQADDDIGKGQPQSDQLVRLGRIDAARAEGALDAVDQPVSPIASGRGSMPAAQARISSSSCRMLSPRLLNWLTAPGTTSSARPATRMKKIA